VEDINLRPQAKVELKIQRFTMRAPVWRFLLARDAISTLLNQFRHHKLFPNNKCICRYLILFASEEISSFIKSLQELLVIKT